MEHRRIDLGSHPILAERTKRERPELQWLPINRLLIDDSYQRALSKGNWTAIRRIAKNFDWAKFTPMLVAPLEGGYFAVIDGQHRVHGAAMAGEAEVPAMICAMTHAQQAAAFSWVNGNVTNITSFHLYKTGLCAGEPWAIRSRATVEAAGCRLMTSHPSAANKKPREIYCIALIRDLVGKGRSKTITTGLKALSCDGARDAEIVAGYSYSVLRAWVAAIGDVPGLGQRDLNGFCRANSLVNVLDRCRRLRAEGDFRKESLQPLFVRSLIALLHKFQTQSAQSQSPNLPAPVASDEAVIGSKMAVFAAIEMKRTAKAFGT